MAALNTFEKLDTICHLIVRNSAQCHKPYEKSDPVAYGILVLLNPQDNSLMFSAFRCQLHEIVIHCADTTSHFGCALQMFPV